MKHTQGSFFNPEREGEGGGSRNKTAVDAVGHAGEGVKVRANRFGALASRNGHLVA